MGGGGGGRGPTMNDFKKLAEEVRKTVEKQAGPERRNVFISFVREDLQDVNLLRGQAKNEDSALEFNDWSVREPFGSDRADYIRLKIRERIRQCSVTVVYVSEDTAPSKWVDWEIRESLRLGNGVVAVYKGDKPPSQLPPSLAEAKIQPISWTQEGIALAIRRAAKDAEK